MADLQGLRLAQAPFQVQVTEDGEHTAILDQAGGIVCRLNDADIADVVCEELNASAESGGLEFLWASGGHPDTQAETDPADR